MRHHAPERFRLPGWVRAVVYSVGAICLLSGMIWLFLHHFVRVEGEFGPQAHPLEHPSLVVHGVTGCAMLWVFGLIWLPHIKRAWHRRRNRISGGTMAALMIWLGVSGCGLYYLGDETWRELTSFGHWMFGLTAAAWLPIHIWRGRKATKENKLQ